MLSLRTLVRTFRAISLIMCWLNSWSCAYLCINSPQTFISIKNSSISSKFSLTNLFVCFQHSPVSSFIQNVRFENLFILIYIKRHTTLTSYLSFTYSTEPLHSWFMNIRSFVYSYICFDIGLFILKLCQFFTHIRQIVYSYGHFLNNSVTFILKDYCVSYSGQFYL